MILGQPLGASTDLLCLAVFACSLLSSAGAQSNTLAPGILKALRSDELQCCKQASGGFEESCHRTFVANLRWRELRVAPEKTGIVVENRNQGFCGSAGCALHLLIQRSDGSFAEVLDEVGALGSLRSLKSITKGYYDLQKTSADHRTKTIYRWDGSGYVAE